MCFAMMARRTHVSALVVLVAVAARRGAADEQPTPASNPPGFSPGQISVGDPIPLPYDRAGSASAPTGGSAASPGLASGDAGGARFGAPPSAFRGAAGPGWLGLTLAESRVPGRWEVVEVVPRGPAALAGVQLRDEVRAINGLPLRNGEEVSQSLTAIAAGQPVRIAIGRGDSVTDVVLTAVSRPAASAAPREWQAAPATPPAAATASRSEPIVAAPSEPVGGAPAMLSPPRGRIAIGVRTLPIDAQTQVRYRLPEAAGALVIGVVQDLPAARAGVPPGSVIVGIGDRPVRSPEDLTRLVTGGPAGQAVTVQYVLPGGEEKRADVVLQALELPLERALLGEGPRPTAVPTLMPGGGLESSRSARRPVTAPMAADVDLLRQRIEILERRLKELERRPVRR